MTLWYVGFERGDDFVGGLYVWARDKAAALRKAALVGAPADCVAGAHQAENPDLVALLPAGFLGRWLSPEEVMESERAVLRALAARQAVRRASA